MADVKISDLTELTSLDDNNDLFEVVDSSAGLSKKVKKSTLKDAMWEDLTATADEINGICDGLPTNSQTNGSGSEIQLSSSYQNIVVASLGDVKAGDAFVVNGLLGLHCDYSAMSDMGYLVIAYIVSNGAGQIHPINPYQTLAFEKQTSGSDFYPYISVSGTLVMSADKTGLTVTLKAALLYGLGGIYARPLQSAVSWLQLKKLP